MLYYYKNKYKLYVKNLYGYSLIRSNIQIILSLFIIYFSLFVVIYALDYSIKNLFIFMSFYLFFETLYIKFLYDKLTKKTFNIIIKGER